MDSVHEYVGGKEGEGVSEEEHFFALTQSRRSPAFSCTGSGWAGALLVEYQ